MPALSTATIANPHPTLTFPRTQGHLSKQPLNSQIPASTQHQYLYPQPYTTELSATTSETQVQSRPSLKPTSVSAEKKSGLGLTLDSRAETLYNAHSRNTSAASSSGSLAHGAGRRLSVRRATPADALGIARICLHAFVDDAERRRPGPSMDVVGQGDDELQERSSSSASDGSVANSRNEIGNRLSGSGGTRVEEDVDGRKIKSICKRMRHAELPAAVRALPYLHLRSGFVFVLVESIPEGGIGADAPDLTSNSRRAAAPSPLPTSNVKDAGIGGSTSLINTMMAGPSTITTAQKPTTTSTVSTAPSHLWERRAAHLENLRANAHNTTASNNGHGRGESVASNASTAISTTSGVSAFTTASATTARTSMASTSSANARQISRKPSKPILTESITASPASSFLELGPSSLNSPRGLRLPSSPRLSPLPECDRPLSAISSRSNRSSFRNSMQSPAKPRGPRPLPKPPALSRGRSTPEMTTSRSSPGNTQNSLPAPSPAQASLPISDSNGLALKSQKSSASVPPPLPPPSLRLPPRPSPHEIQVHPYARPDTPLKFLPALTPPPPPPPSLFPQPPALTLPSHHPSSPPKRTQALDSSHVSSTSTSNSLSSNASSMLTNATELPRTPIRYTEHIVGYVLGTPHTARFAAEADVRWWPRLRKLYPREMQGTPLDRYFIAQIHSRQLEKERREKEGELLKHLNGKRTRRREKGRGVLRLSAKAGLVTTLSERGGVGSEGDSSSSSSDGHDGSTRRDEETADPSLTKNPKNPLPPLYAAARALSDVQDAPADGGPPQLHICVLRRVRDAEGGEGAAYERLLMDAAMRHLRETSSAERDEARAQAKMDAVAVAEQARAGVKR